MGRKTSDLIWSQVYSPFLNKGFKNNPTNNKQARIERMYFRILSELAMNRFEWKGLPNSIDTRFLEKTLFQNALAVFYWDKDYDRYLALRASGAGELNMYDNPVSYTVTGNRWINKTLSHKDCVPIWSNYLRMPDLDVVIVYSEKLANIDRSIEIVSSNMRMSRMITADENSRLSAQNINRQIEEGVGAIFVNRGMTEIEISSIDMNVDPRTLPALMQTKTDLWSECMMLLGINSNPGEGKKERLVADEVSANDDQIAAARAVNLNARQKACDDINRKYSLMGEPLNVSVDFRAMGKPLIPGASDEFEETGF